MAVYSPLRRCVRQEKYARSWLDMSFEDDVLKLAYEKTCLNTGGLNWAYMNKILLRWQQAGYRTVADVPSFILL